MRGVATVFAQQLWSYVTTPVAYVVGVMFFIMQGTSFWAVVKVLADVEQQAPYQAVLQSHFGGSLLSWSIVLAVVSTLSMRLCAEDRRSGMWESNLAAGTSDGAMLVGKFLAALTVYCALWALTLLYPLLLVSFAPVGSGIDWGPVGAAYLGVGLFGAALLAIGLAISAATANQIVAAITTFSIGMLLVLVGELPELLPGSGRSAAISALDLRGHMTMLAGGTVSLPPLAVGLGFVGVGLVAARTLIEGARRGAQRRLRWQLGLGLVAAIACMTTVLASRHPAPIDVTENNSNSLSAATEQILDDVRGVPIKVTVIEPSLDSFVPVFDQVDKVLARMADRQGSMTIERVDETSKKQMRKLALEFALEKSVIEEGGVVVFEFADRRRAINLTAIASFRADELGVLALEALVAEEAFAGAVLELSQTAVTTVCATSGRGELSLANDDDDGRDWVLVGHRLSADGVQLVDVGSVAAGVPERCAVVIVAGPTVPLSPDEAIAIKSFLDSGGGLLVASNGLVSGTADVLSPTGLELVLADYGIALPRAVVIDATREVGIPLFWATVDGYAPHPITGSFAKRRATVWPAPRAVRATPPAVALVAGSVAAWAETDIRALSAGDAVAADADGEIGLRTVAAAAERRGRVVVLGSAAVAERSLVEKGFGFGDSLVVASVGWLARRTVRVEIGDKRPEHLRLLLTSTRQPLLFALGIGLLPGVLTVLGLLMWWRRRRDR